MVPIRAFTPLAAAAVLALAGCAQDGTTVRSDGSSSSPGSSGSAMAANNQQSDAASGMNALAFPTSDRQTSAILLEANGPDEVRAGEEFTYELTLTNLTDAPLHQVAVLNYGGPGGQMQPQSLLSVGTLPPNETMTRSVSGTIDEAGLIRNCLGVSYQPTLCLEVAVVNPELQIRKEGPQEVVFCQGFTYTYTVTNTGSGTAENVQVRDELPAGLVTADGKRVITRTIGALAAGQSQSFDVQLEAREPGEYQSRAIARSAGDESRSAMVQTAVREAELAVSIEAPDAEYIGQSVNYRVTVRNTGDAPSQATTLQLQAPGARQDLSSRPNPALEPGQSRTYNITAMSGNEEGTLELTATAEAFCEKVDDVVATAQTEILGIAALQLEVVDGQDPVQIGQETRYLVKVTNEGTAAEADVRLTAQLPEQMAFVRAEGDSDVQAEGQQLDFAGITIQPGDEATWTVVARAESAGRVQFALQMNSPTLDRPVIEREPTRLYEPGAAGEEVGAENRRQMRDAAERNEARPASDETPAGETPSGETPSGAGNGADTGDAPVNK